MKQLKVEIKCINCGENLNITIENNKIISIELNDVLHTSEEEEIKNILEGRGIEFG